MSELNTFLSLAKSNPISYDPKDGTIEESGFIENATASMATFVDQDLSVSRWIDPTRITNLSGMVNGDAWGNAFTDRNDEILRLKEEGAYTPEEWRRFSGRFGGTNWEGLGELAREKGFDIKTDDQVMEGIRENVRINAEAQERISNRAGLSGKLGEFTGTVWGAGLDPINILATAAIPMKALQGASVLKRAALVGGASAGAELAIQPFVYNWKNDLGLDYSVTDAAINVGAAFGFGATLSAFTDGAAKLASKTWEKYNPDVSIKGLEKEIKETGQISKRSRKTLEKSGMDSETIDSVEAVLDSVVEVNKIKGEQSDLTVGEYQSGMTAAEKELNNIEPRVLKEDGAPTSAVVAKTEETQPKKMSELDEKEKRALYVDYKEDIIDHWDRMTPEERKSTLGGEYKNADARSAFSKLSAIKRSTVADQYLDQVAKVTEVASPPVKPKPVDEVEVARRMEEISDEDLDLEINDLLAKMDGEDDLIASIDLDDGLGGIETRHASMRDLLDEIDSEEVNLNEFMVCIRG